MALAGQREVVALGMYASSLQYGLMPRGDHGRVPPVRSPDPIHGERGVAGSSSRDHCPEDDKLLDDLSGNPIELLMPRR